MTRHDTAAHTAGRISMQSNELFYIHTYIVSFTNYCNRSLHLHS